jgi:actin-related protein 3
LYTSTIRFTKVGFAGDAEPQDVFQTAIGKRIRSSKDTTLEDLNFVIGRSNNSNNNSSSSSHSTQQASHPSSISSTTHNLRFPIKHGIIDDWDTMEQLWQMCIYNKLRCNPEEHYFLLTEPPLNKPENREQMAEILFETFNIPGMNISVQAVLSLAASWTNEKVKSRALTGLVVDSGYGSTHIVPVVDGHVISSCIEQMNIGGRDVTTYVQELMRERKEPIPHEMRADIARIVKEQYSYTVPSIEKELGRYDSNPEKYIKKYESIHKKTGQKWSCNIGYERFLAPEVVLNPSVSSKTQYNIMQYNTKNLDNSDLIFFNCCVCLS